MPRTNDETRILFDRWAATYDQNVAHDASGPLTGYTHSLHAAAALVSFEPGGHVLDFGIGTGAFAALFARRGAAIWGVDISEQMIDRCLQAHPDFQVTVGSFTPIPYADEQFDVVISSFAIHEIMAASRQAACFEFARVVRRGGQICLLDIMFASQPAMHEAQRLLGNTWDWDEDYPLVSNLDMQLRQAGCGRLRWQQTTPMHWAVVGRRLD